MKKIVYLGFLFGFMPFISFASQTGQDAFGIITIVNQILSWIIPILITLAVIYFIWGVIQYTVSGDEEKKKKARSMIIQGLIGLFVIVAFWGIISLITNTFGVGPQKLDSRAIPCVPGPGVNCE